MPGGQSGGWEFHGEFGIMPASQNDVVTQRNAIHFTTEFPATVVDVNGDGLADLVLVAESVDARAEVDVLLNSGALAVGQNDGTGQQTPWTLQMISSPGFSGTIPRLFTGLTQVQMQLQDVNRDGLPDLFSLGVDPEGSITDGINESSPLTLRRVLQCRSDTARGVCADSHRTRRKLAIPKLGRVTPTSTATGFTTL